MLEIEQKFTFRYIPFSELNILHHTVIFRQYLSINPEVRISKRVFDDGTVKYHLTVKEVNYIVRKESKIELTETQYLELSSAAEKCPMIYDVWSFKTDNDKIISFKVGKNIKSAFAEIEYHDIGEYLIFKDEWVKYPYIGREVTLDDRYYVKNVWREYCSE